MNRELERNRNRSEATISEQLNSEISVIHEESDRSFANSHAYVRDEWASVVSFRPAKRSIPKPISLS